MGLIVQNHGFQGGRTGKSCSKLKWLSINKRLGMLQLRVTTPDDDDDYLSQARFNPQAMPKPGL